jgi:ATP-dependent exoDNAse (exonuclease V) beta subunit
VSQSSAEDFPNASIVRRAVGIVVHRWLEEIADHLEQWAADDIVTKRPVIRQQLLGHGVSHQDIESATDEVIEHIQLTLGCEIGQSILQSYPESATELEIECRQGKQVRFFIIDRTFVDAQGQRIIVDYKTSQRGEKSMTEFLADEQATYQEQLENYGRLMHELEARPVKLMLYFTAHQRYVEWDYQPVK